MLYQSFASGTLLVETQRHVMLRMLRSYLVRKRPHDDLPTTCRRVSTWLQGYLLPLSVGRTHVFSRRKDEGIPLGAIASRGRGMAAQTPKYSELLPALHALARYLPAYTSFQISQMMPQVRVKRHIDVKNDGDSYVMIFGQFKGGRLFVKRGTTWHRYTQRCTWRKIPAGSLHYVSQVSSGVRYSVVACVPRGASFIDQSTKEQIEEHGFPFREWEQRKDFYSAFANEVDDQVPPAPPMPIEEDGAEDEQAEDHLPNWARGYPQRGRRVQNEQGPPAGDTVSREARMAAKRLHEDLGHPSTTKLMRSLRDMGEEKAAALHVCPGCLSIQRPAPPLAAKLPLAENFGDLVHFDLYDLRDIKGQKINMLNMVDHATQYQLAVPVPGKHRRVVFEAFCRFWMTAFEKPHSIHADQGGEFHADFQEEMQALGISVVHSARFAPYQNAQAERRGGVYKYIAQAAAINAGVRFALVFDNQERLSSDTWTFLQACAHSAHSMIRPHGYSPAQLAFARSLQMPYELLSPYAQYAMASRVDNDPDFARKFSYLRAARSAAPTCQHDQRLVAAIAARPRGDRTQQPVALAAKPGDQIFFWISPSPRYRTKRWWVHRWVGPAVLLGYESDSAWVSWKRQLLKVARHHTRPASIEERTQWREMAQHMYDPAANTEYENVRERTHRPPDPTGPHPDAYGHDKDFPFGHGVGDPDSRHDDRGDAEKEIHLYEPSEYRTGGQPTSLDLSDESCVADPEWGSPGRKFRLRAKRPHPYLYMDRTARKIASNDPSRYALTQEKTHMHATDPQDPRLYDETMTCRRILWPGDLLLLYLGHSKMDIHSLTHLRVKERKERGGVTC